MNTGSDHMALDRMARITGGCYLAFILASVIASTVGQIGLSDPQQVYQAIATNPWSFRLGLVSALTSAFLFLMVPGGSAEDLGPALGFS